MTERTEPKASASTGVSDSMALLCARTLRRSVVSGLRSAFPYIALIVQCVVVAVVGLNALWLAQLDLVFVPLMLVAWCVVNSIVVFNWLVDRSVVHNARHNRPSEAKVRVDGVVSTENRRIDGNKERSN